MTRQSRFRKKLLIPKVVVENSNVVFRFHNILVTRTKFRAEESIVKKFDLSERQIVALLHPIQQRLVVGNLEAASASRIMTFSCTAFMDFLCYDFVSPSSRV